ncbi:MAG: transposase [Selenomonadaceae bacterium]|nr:transposase [Selenomonadaceae bacterium]
MLVKFSVKSVFRPEVGFIQPLEGVREGDELFVTSLYRLDRDKDTIKDELRFFKKKSVMELVNHLLIEVFSFIAQEERENIRRRQAEGIALWRKTEKTKTGRPYGRPKIKLPSNWKKIYSLRKEKKLKTKEAWFLLKISKNVFNAIMWMLKSGVRWRDLPSRYGNWNSIYPNLARIPPPL